jgi:ribosomal protein S8E
VRGGNVKWRALRLDTGNYSWGSEAVTRKTRILDVVYNASNNELVRTQTLVKSAIIQVDAAPFRQWYEQHYGLDIGRKKKAAAAKKETTEVNRGKCLVVDFSIISFTQLNIELVNVKLFEVLHKFFDVVSLAFIYFHDS